MYIIGQYRVKSLTINLLQWILATMDISQIIDQPQAPGSTSPGRQ